MSLTTVTALLDNKLRSLRNSSVDSEKDVIIEEKSKVSPTSTLQQNPVTTTVVITPSPNTVSSTSQRPFSHLTYQSNNGNSNINRPLTLGENIPFADESPERPLIQARIKPMRMTSKVPGTSNNISHKKDNSTIMQSQTQQQKDLKHDSMASSSSTLSEDTDASTTSNPREKFVSAIRLDTEVLRKVNRILTNLEHLERKYSLNRSLSLNYKNHRNNECCCNHNQNNNLNTNHSTNIHGSNNIRLLLTKDEKTDKNISKKRQLIDSQAQQTSGTSASNRRRHLGSSRIRRRHTVGGTQDYYPNTKVNAGNCQSYINKHHNIPYKTSKTSNNDDSSDENKSDGN